MFANLSKKWLIIGIIQLGGVFAFIGLLIKVAAISWPYLVAIIAVLIEQVVVDYFVLKNIKAI